MTAPDIKTSPLPGPLPKLLRLERRKLARSWAAWFDLSMRHCTNLHDAGLRPLVPASAPPGPYLSFTKAARLLGLTTMALRKCVERLNASGRPSQLGVVRIGAESRVVQRGENIHSPDLAPTKDVTEGKRPILRLSRWQLNLFLRAKPQRMSKEITGWIEACQEKYLDPGAGPDRQTQWREAPLPHVPLRLAPEAGEPLGRWLLTQFGAVDAQRQAEIPGMGADLSVRLPGNLLLRVECARREGEDNRLVFFGPKNLLAREMILVMEDGREIRVDVRPERILTWAPPETPQHGPQQT